MTSKEYLEQIARTKVIDCTYNDKAIKPIALIFPVGIDAIKKDLEIVEKKKKKLLDVGNQVQNTITCLEADKKEYKIKAISIDYVLELLEDINKRLLDLECEVILNDKS